MSIYVNEIKLDKYQIDAVTSMNDATVVVAGAGSGKTLTIQAKIKYLLDNGYKENEILVISFTNKSVNDIKEKLNKLNISIDTFTFHKLCINILNNDNYKLINNNYLDYIIDEYFKSYLYSNKNIIKRLLYSEHNIDKIFNSNKYNTLKYEISYFIKLAKSNNIEINNLYEFYKKSNLKNKTLLKTIMDIYLIYKRELESTNSLDLDDLIIYTTNHIKEHQIKYKYIIIDEFQDTSFIRFNLVLEIIKYTNAKLMAVGDDYQSIYKFNGCDINIFLSLKDYIKDTKYCYLRYTYRNSNELIKVSTSFITKNRYQLKKTIESSKHINKPIKILFNYNIDDALKLDTNILILGRNNKDIDNINYPNKLTIHKSKGLEADNVLLVNSDNLPNKIYNNSLFDLVLKKDEILYAEERRLFYVALTRTKNNVYIMVNKKISPFVKELILHYSKYIEIIRK